MATENLKSFLEKIKDLTLFKRIFKWSMVFNGTKSRYWR